MLGHWRDALDVLARLLPGASIIVAIILGRRQLKGAQRATAVTIAKAHFREFITLALWNSDVTARGATPESLLELRKDAAQYRRYRWLATQGLFALQEMYFAVPDSKEWRRMIVVISSNFRAFILSQEDLPTRQRQAWSPEFMDFLTTSLQEFVHPLITLAVPLGDPSEAAPFREVDDFDRALVSPTDVFATATARRRAKPGTTSAEFKGCQ